MKVVFSIGLFFSLYFALGQNAFIRTYGAEGAFNDGVGVAGFSDTSTVILANRLSPSGVSSMWLFRVDQQGIFIWEKYFEEFTLSSGNDLSEYDDTSVIICGTVLLPDGYDFFAARVGMSGQIIWQNVWGDASWDAALSSVTDSSGNVWITGYSLANDTFDQDMVICAFNGLTGDSIISRRFDDGYEEKGIDIDTAYGDKLLVSMQRYDPVSDTTVSRLYLFDHLLDTVWSFDPVIDSVTFFIKGATIDFWGRVFYYGDALPDTASLTRLWYGTLDPSGSIIFEFIFHPDYIRSVRQVVMNNQGQTLVLGNTSGYWFGNSDVGLWVDSAGYVNFRYYGALQEDVAADLAIAVDSGLVIVGSTKSFGPGVTNVFFIRVGSDYAYSDVDYIHYTPVQTESALGATLFPNPSTGTFAIRLPEPEEVRLEVFTLNGQQVADERYWSESLYTLPALPDGLYMIRVSSGTRFYFFKLLLQQK